MQLLYFLSFLNIYCALKWKLEKREGTEIQENTIQINMIYLTIILYRGRYLFNFLFKSIV